MSCDQRLQFGDEFCVSPAREIGLDPLFERRQPKLVQPRNVDDGERVVRELRQRRPAPDRQRVPQRPRGDVRLAGRQRLPSLREQRLEAVQVELSRRDPQQVAVRTRQQYAVVVRLSIPRRRLALEHPA